jgi:hypothetical protein
LLRFDLAHQYTYLITYDKSTPTLFTDKAQQPRVKVIVVPPQHRDVYKPLNEVPLEFDKYTKLGHGGDNARQHIAYPILQKITFHPTIHHPSRTFGTALVTRTSFAQPDQVIRARQLRFPAS